MQMISKNRTIIEKPDASKKKQCTFVCIKLCNHSLLPTVGGLITATHAISVIATLGHILEIQLS